mgnify:CR=1 FL=1
MILLVNPDPDLLYLFPARVRIVDTAGGRDPPHSLVWVQRSNQRKTHELIVDGLLSWLLIQDTGSEHAAQVKSGKKVI